MSSLKIGLNRMNCEEEAEPGIEVEDLLLVNRRLK